jgi:hypothetical protein
LPAYLIFFIHLFFIFLLLFLLSFRFLFICGLFNDSISSSDCISSNDIMNWKYCRRKRSWPNLRYYPGICLEGLKRTTRLLRIAGLWAEI